MAHIKKSASTGHLLKNASGHLADNCGGGATVDCANSDGGTAPESFFLRFAADAIIDRTCTTCGDNINGDTKEIPFFVDSVVLGCCIWRQHPIDEQECSNDLNVRIEVCDAGASWEVRVYMSFAGIGGSEILWRKTYGAAPDLLAFADEEIPYDSTAALSPCEGLGSVFLTPV